MSELELLRVAIVPLISAIVFVIGSLIKFQYNQLATTKTENIKLYKDLNTERGDHQQTKNDLTQFEAQYIILKDSYERAANTEETYKQQIRELFTEINQNKQEFDTQLKKLRTDFNTQIDDLNKKHTEFVSMRNTEIQAKDIEIKRLIDLSSVVRRNHDREIKIKDEQLNDFRERFKKLESEHLDLKEKFEKLMNRLDTQELKLPDGPAKDDKS